MQATESLFAYGTLQREEVQLANFGRKLEGVMDSLVGYRLVMVTIEDEEFVSTSGGSEHRNLEFTGSSVDVVEGMVFKLTPEELRQADAYEPEGYARVAARSRGGSDVWVYVKR
jgi:Gamma-glutamyl cyclotransferase, AIG2-like